MKFIYTLTICLLWPFAGAFAQKPKPVNDKDATPNTTAPSTILNMPIEKVEVNPIIIEFKEKVHNYGTIKHNVPATCEFVFTNKGKSSVSIKDVQTSCGCTTPGWTDTPIAPGKTGKIAITYSAGGIGNFTKSITVKFYGDIEEYLTITGVIVDTPADSTSTPVNH